MAQGARGLTAMRRLLDGAWSRWPEVLRIMVKSVVAATKGPGGTSKRPSEYVTVHHCVHDTID